jgi:hypothetical protein
MAFQLEPWFSQTADTELEQGDILPSIRIVNELEAIEFDASVIVLSQSCDLAIQKNGIRGLNSVLVCGVRFENDPDAKKLFKEWSNILAGRRPDKFALPPCYEIDGTNPRVIADFAELFIIPINIALEAAKTLRPRMIHPYRQQFSQSFARVFMRVEIPDLDPRRTG